MSHYEKQREAQAAKDREEEEYRLRTLSNADYEYYVNGVLQIQEDALDSLVAQAQADGQYDAEADLIEYMEPEFYDFLKVLAMGAKKHGNKNWLNADGKKSSHKDMHASMFRHLAQSFANQRLDTESGLDHLLHLASRSLMCYTLIKRRITHKEDL